MRREWLEEHVARGLSIAAIAEASGRSRSTVRYWLARHGLITVRTAEIRATRASLRETDRGLEGHCPRHGDVRFVSRERAAIRCSKCRSEAVMARRRRVKEILVAEAGGQCLLCGYDRVPAALQFHHIDRATKSFSLSRHGVTRSLAAARAEAAKCLLLCANCHAEVEVGAASIPAQAPGSPGSLSGR